MTAKETVALVVGYVVGMLALMFVAWCGNWWDKGPE